MANGIFFTRDFSPDIGGVAEHSHQMVKHLAELGENITLLHYVSQGFPGDEGIDDSRGYRVVRFSTRIGTGRWYKDPWCRRLLFTTLLREARRVAADYVVYNRTGGNPLFDASLAAVPRILRIPAFIYVHDAPDMIRLWGMRSKLQVFASNWLYGSAAGVLTVSRYNLPLLEEARLNPGRIHVIHNGFDTREADAYLSRRDSRVMRRLDAAFPRTTPVILSVSRLVSHKRMERLIEVMPRVLASVPGAQLVIAGTGEEEDRLRKMVADSPARDSITMLGIVSREEKFEWYARCSVFALATDWEGFGLTFLEASSFRKPVVGTAVGGVPEAIEHGVSGLLVEPGDGKALADAIIRLLSDTEEARRLGECGRRRVETEFTWKQSAEKMRAVAHKELRH